MGHAIVMEIAVSNDAAARTTSSVPLHVEFAKALDVRIASMIAQSLEKTQTMSIEVSDSRSHILIVISIQIATVWHNILTEKILMNLMNFQQFVNTFPIKIFHLAS